jgi:hypothetical protein
MNVLSMPTIKQLRQKGYKVRVMHTRNFDLYQRIDGVAKEISNFGGNTKIEVTTPDMTTTVTGQSKCSDKDNFNRRLGNSIALGRALDKLKVKAL